MTETSFEPAALSQLLALWQEAMPADAPSPARLRDVVLLNPLFRPAGLRLLWARDELTGFGYAVAGPPTGAGSQPETGGRRTRTGWLVALGVAPGARRSGHGARLLRSCLRYLTDAGCSAAEIGGPGERYLVPGVDAHSYPGFAALLAASGFRSSGSTVAMACPLPVAPPDGAAQDQAAPDQAAPDQAAPDQAAPDQAAPRDPAPDRLSHEYRHPRDGELPELLAFASAHFGPSWSGLIRDHLTRAGDNDRLWIARGASGLAGFAGSDLFPGCPGRFGPIGVADSARGHGVGGTLLRRALADMTQRGHRSAWFLWGPSGAAARRMYHSAGFQVTRTFGFAALDLRRPAMPDSHPYPCDQAIPQPGENP